MDGMERIGGETARELPAPGATKVTRRRVVLDVEDGVVTIDGSTFTATGLPDAVLNELALRGLATMLCSSDTPDALMARIRAEGLPTRRKAGEKPLDPWRQAYVNALLAKVNPRRGPVVLAVKEAERQARALTTAELVEVKRDPAVVTAYRKLSGEELPPSPLERAIAAARGEGAAA